MHHDSRYASITAWLMKQLYTMIIIGYADNLDLDI